MAKEIHSQSAYFPTLSPDLSDKERADAGLPAMATPAYLRLTAKPFVASTVADSAFKGNGRSANGACRKGHKIKGMYEIKLAEKESNR